MGIITAKSIDDVIERIKKHECSGAFVDFALSVTASIDATGIVFIQEDDGADRYVFVVCGLSDDQWINMSPYDRRVCINAIPLFDLHNGDWITYRQTGLNKL